jgi:hypothetical protein
MTRLSTPVGRRRAGGSRGRGPCPDPDALPDHDALGLTLLPAAVACREQVGYSAEDFSSLADHVDKSRRPKTQKNYASQLDKDTSKGRAATDGFATWMEKRHGLNVNQPCMAGEYLTGLRFVQYAAKYVRDMYEQKVSAHTLKAARNAMGSLWTRLHLQAGMTEGVQPLSSQLLFKSEYGAAMNKLQAKGER